MDYDKIGKFICLRRKALGYTQEELGLKVGVTNKAVSKWENGLGCPDISILEPLAKILKVNVIELLKGQDYDDNLFSKEETSNFIIEMFKISNLKTKEKIKKIVSSLIISFVTILTVFLIILNVLNMVYVNKYEKFDIVSNNQVSLLKDKIVLINNNIDKIINLEFLKDKESIKIDLEKAKFNINNNALLSFKINDKIYFDDLSHVANNSSKMYTLSIIDTLSKSDIGFKNFSNYIKRYTTSNIVLNNYFYMEYIEAYDYHFLNNHKNSQLKARIQAFTDDVYDLEFLTNEILKLGGAL